MEGCPVFHKVVSRALDDVLMKFTGVSKEGLQKLQPVKEMPEAYLGKTSYWT